MIGLARALAIELAPDVRVNVINPGPANTPMLAGFGFDADVARGAAAEAPDRARGHRRRRRLPGVTTTPARSPAPSSTSTGGATCDAASWRSTRRPATSSPSCRRRRPEQVAEMVEDARRALDVERDWRTPLVRVAHAGTARATRRRRGRRARRPRDPRHRQAALPGQGRRRRDGPLPRVLRGLDRAPRGPHDPARPRRARLHAPRAVGRVRPDHPVELPAAGHRALRRARARGRQRGDPQALRAGLDHAAAARPSSPSAPASRAG